jgi:excisionase family DNA binding protein
MNENQDEMWLTVPQVAPQVNMTLQALYKACRDGDFPCVRIGKRRIRIPSSALKRFLEDKTTGLQAKTQPDLQAATA